MTLDEGRAALGDELERLLSEGGDPDATALAERFGVPLAEVEDCWRALRLLEEALAEPPLADATLDTVVGGPSLAAQAAQGSLRRLAGYDLRGELARGGMGVVYRAWHPGLEREVALKVSLAGEHASPRQVERLLNEARAAARLKHPNVVAVHEVGEAAGIHFFVMDLVEGESLDQRIQRAGALPIQEAVQICERVADALSYAHQNAILHRDVKPANVLLAEGDGRPVLTDFGLAKDVLSEDRKLTKTGQMLGTPAYMPPEQALGQLALIDRRADVYAVGATLYEALTGEPPFGGSSAISVVQRAVHEEAAPPSKLRPEVDADLDTICLRCLEKEPELRYGTAEALAADLRRYLAGEPVLARPPSWLQRAGKWTRRNRPLAASLAALIALVVVGGPLGLAASVKASQNAAERASQALIGEARRDAESQLASGATRLADHFQVFLAANRWQLLAPTDPDALRALTSAALALGELAERQSDWSLARETYTVLRRVDPGAAEAALAACAEREAALDAQRRAEVAARLDRARRGELTAAGYQDALFAIVGLSSSQTDAQLLDELRAVTAELRRVTLATYAEVLDPTEGERWREARQLERGWVRRTCTPLQATLRQRLTLRAHAGAYPELQLGFDATWLDVIAARQRAVLDPRSQLTQLVCDALGRMTRAGRGELLDVLQILAVGEDDATVAAAVAYARFAPGRADEVLGPLVRRFGRGSVFYARVRDYIQFELAEESWDEAERPTNAAGYGQLGRRRAELADFVGARQAFHRSTLLNPDQPVVWFELGQAHIQLGEYEDALRALGHATEQDPDNGRYLGTRALARFNLGQHADALTDAERALELEPGAVDALLTRALALDALGRDADAERAWAHLVDERPDFAGGWLGRARWHLHHGRLAEAVADAEHALELRPGAPESWSTLGRAHLEADRFDEALAAFSRGLEVSAPSADLYSNRSYARLAGGDLAGALTDADRAIELEPEFPLAWVNRAQAKLALEREADAAADLEHFLELAAAARFEHPSVAYARETLERLRGAHTQRAGQSAD